jgi:hypothetical protein
MTSIASSSISRRTGVDGHWSPKTCSLSASPLPTPKKNRPGMRQPAVAAAWATRPGCMRTVGQVTPVPSRIRSVAVAMPPTTAHTKGLWPCSRIQGW